MVLNKSENEGFVLYFCFHDVQKHEEATTTILKTFETDLRVMCNSDHLEAFVLIKHMHTVYIIK